MVSSLYREWGSAWNKDDLKYYDNVNFRRDYTRLEMNSKANIFQKMAADDVQTVLRDICSQTRRNEIHIVSLGCGPGSDLLGTLRAIDSAVQSGSAELSRRTWHCNCTGVDAFDWNREVFAQSKRQLDIAGALGTVSCEFIHQDMESFALNRLRGYDRSEFDFICLSFADAGRNLQLIGTALPQLLSSFGRILVLDNDIPTVRSLVEYGFTCTFAGNGICMHSRDRDSQWFHGTYQPESNSPIRKFRETKAKEDEARLQEERRMQSMSRSQAYSYNAYPYSTRETSWCERNCSIL